ncbi:DUF4913 domain-containing protein [Streptomyces sp. NPDC050560]|uniref:DUF4913 domain-containing protein n=1 Tax=Streptomyces sp. NPDC050560 TaxID=3365630 RepID=UPI0037875B3D
MTAAAEAPGGSDAATAPDEQDAPEERSDPQPPPFILYQDGPAYGEALHRLTLWVRHLLLPVYGREVTSNAPWCTRWWLHPEAVAQLYGLWMAWQGLTGDDGGLAGPAMWHRDYLGPVMTSLRDPGGPFAGCKAGAHRDKEAPGMDPFTD